MAAKGLKWLYLVLTPRKRYIPMMAIKTIERIGYEAGRLAHRGAFEAGMQKNMLVHRARMAALDFRYFWDSNFSELDHQRKKMNRWGDQKFIELAYSREKPRVWEYLVEQNGQEISMCGADADLVQTIKELHGKILSSRILLEHQVPYYIKGDLVDPRPPWPSQPIVLKDGLPLPPTRQALTPLLQAEQAVDSLAQHIKDLALDLKVPVDLKTPVDPITTKEDAGRKMASLADSFGITTYFVPPGLLQHLAGSKYTVGIAYPLSQTICISDDATSEYKANVIAHEIGHVLFSHDKHLPNDTHIDIGFRSQEYMAEGFAYCLMQASGFSTEEINQLGIYAVRFEQMRHAQHRLEQSGDLTHVDNGEDRVRSLQSMALFFEDNRERMVMGLSMSILTMNGKGGTIKSGDALPGQEIIRPVQEEAGRLPVWQKSTIAHEEHHGREL